MRLKCVLESPTRTALNKKGKACERAWERCRPPAQKALSLWLLQGERNKAHLVAGFHLDEDIDLVFVLSLIRCLLDALDHVRRLRHGLARYLEDDIAGLESLVGGVAVGSDLGDDDASLTCAGHLLSRRQREPKVIEPLAGLWLVERSKLLTAWEGTKLHVDLVLYPIANNGELDIGVGMQLGDLASKVARVVDLVAIHRDDDVAGLDVLFSGGAVLGHLGNHGALRLREADRIGDLVGHVLDDDAKPAAIDGAMLLQLTDHLLDECRRNREGNADTAARGREDRGIHADDLAVQIEGRATGVAAVHRCIDLQVVIWARANVAVAGGDDSTSHRAAEAERIAYREHSVADPGVLLRELHVGELLGGFDLEERHVGANIGPY